MIGSVFYLATFLGVFYYFYRCKKTTRKLNGFSWGVLSFIIVLCYQAFVAGIFSIINIPVNKVSMGIAYLFLILFFSIQICNKKEKQEYFYNFIDLVPIFMILIIAIIGSLEQFGIGINIRYLTSDPSVHMWNAVQVIEEQRVKGMYFAPLTNSIFMTVLQPICSAFSRYKIFLLCEGVMYCISGMTLWAAMEPYEITNRKSTFFQIVLVFFYMLGYPRSNMLFGFNYLGIGVTLVIVLSVVTNTYIQDLKCQNSCITIMAMLCMSVGLCYSFFAPVAYIAVFCGLSIAYYNSKKSIKSWIIDNLKIFLVPCILVMIYSYMGTFGQDLTVSQGLTIEGYIYKDIFANMWIILLPFLVGTFYLIRTKKFSIEFWMFLIMFLFTVVLFVLGMQEKISAYYYYKTSYLISPFAFLIAYFGMKAIMQNSRETIIAYLVCICGAFLLFQINIEERINQRNPQFLSYSKLPYFFDIYNFNNTSLQTQTYYSDAKIELYRKIYENYSEEDCVCVGNWLDCYWFRALVGKSQNEEKFLYEKLDNHNEIWKNIEEDKKISMMIILYDSDIYKDNESWIHSLDKVYQSDAGCIIKLDKEMKGKLNNE